MKQFGILIPVYNSTAYLNELLDTLLAIQKRNSQWQLIMVIVDDGSMPPVSPVAMEGLKIVQLRHGRNRGKGEALKTGFQYFLGETHVEAIITMDADLQHPPEFIPQFISKFMATGTDLIIGARKKSIGVMPFHRIISNTLTSLVISALIRQWVLDSQCGYRLYSRKLLENIRLSESRFHLESEIVILSGWQNYRSGWIEIPTIYNDAPSAIRNLPDTWNFITLILKFVKRRMLGHV